MRGTVGATVIDGAELRAQASGVIVRVAGHCVIGADGCGVRSRLPSHAGEAQKRRFTREARAVAKLEHPHIVEVHDMGECEDGLYYTMQYVEGPTLAQHIARGRESSIGTSPSGDR